MLSFDDFEVSGTAADDKKFVMTYEAKEDKKTHVDKIVIGFSGVNVDPPENENDSYSDVKKYIADFFGIKKENVYVES